MLSGKVRGKWIAGALVALLVILAISPGAQAVLLRTGAVNTGPSVGGYPSWYQDTTGLALEFCDPRNQAEAAGGWCLLLAADVPVAPEVFPTQFADEHFWFAGNAGMTLGNGGLASLTLALEAAFAAGVEQGGQIAFSRIRVRLDPVPATGTYTFTHPYGREVLEGSQGGRIFFTDDVGINCPPGNFDCAMDSRLGPFLLPSASPGGPELPAVAGPVSGKLYIADPARVGPVTGSSLPNFTDSTGASRNHNIFRVEGPPGSNLGGNGNNFVETTDFSLMGRIYTGMMPGKVEVKRASYARTATNSKLDVFATGFPTAQGRLPGQPRPAATQPVLSFFNAPCDGPRDPVTNNPLGATEVQMFGENNVYWGQSQPAVIPTDICVKDHTARDLTGKTVPAFFPRKVTDQVYISDAAFDPNSRSLSVRAVSSDEVDPVSLTVPGLGTLAGGQITITQVLTPPDEISVQSSRGGSERRSVSTALSTGLPGGMPLAINDAFSFPEDSPSQALDLLANDASVAGWTVTLPAPPQLGTAVVNSNGTVTYTPNANASGLDSFAYRAMSGTVSSNLASVSINITPANDPPAATNDTFTAFLNQPKVLNVLANDTDPDGTADLAGIVGLTTPTPAGASVVNAGTSIAFTATLPGTYTFTYQAVDTTGATSNSATVSIAVASSQTISIARAQLETLASRLRIDGTINPVSNPPERLDIFLVATDGTASLVATALPDAVGLWKVDLRSISVSANVTSVRVTSPGAQATAPLVRR